MSALSKKSGLGKGFGSLMPSDFDESILVDKKDRVQKLFISEIEANPSQPRKHFDEARIEELSQSIKQYGILQPLVVTPNKDKYIIIAGERRFRAAKKAGLKHVPALVRTSEELERLEIGLVENVQRVDLSPLEQAVSIARLHEQFNMSYQDIAKRLGKAHTTIVNITRLLQLPDAAKKALSEGKISEGHARSILALKDYPSNQKELLTSIINRNWSVRQAEQYVVTVKSGKTTRDTKSNSPILESPRAKELSTKLKAPVNIVRTAKGGRLQINFDSEKEMNRIINQILE